MSETGTGKASRGPTPAFRWFVFTLAMLGLLGLLLLGAQLAFFVTVPNRDALVFDRDAVWNIFTTAPKLRFAGAAVSLVLLYIHLSDNDASLSPMRLVRAVRAMEGPAIIAIITVSVFMLPLILAAWEFLFLMAMFLVTTCVACVIFIKAMRSRLPEWLVISVMVLMVAFFGNIGFSDAFNADFTCRADRTLVLKSREVVPCERLILVSDKPFWVVEGPEESRLILQSDVDDEAIDRALGIDRD